MAALLFLPSFLLAADLPSLLFLHCFFETSSLLECGEDCINIFLMYLVFEIKCNFERK